MPLSPRSLGWGYASGSPPRDIGAANRVPSREINPQTLKTIHIITIIDIYLESLNIPRLKRRGLPNSTSMVYQYRFSADGGSPPSAEKRYPRAPSPQRLPTSRLVTHSPTALGNPGSPVKYISGVYKGHSITLGENLMLYSRLQMEKQNIIRGC